MHLPHNILTKVLVSTALLLPAVVIAGQTRVANPQVKPTPGSVIVRPRKIVIRRSAAITRHAPDRKLAVVVLPIVSGIADAAVLARVRSALDVKNAFDYSLNDYREDTWLSDFGYEVHYNAHYLLDITFTQSGLAAYPDTHQKHMLINLRDGNVLKAADVFDNAKLESLAEWVNQELQREIGKLRTENLAAAQDPDERQALTDAYANLKVEREHLDEFSVGKTGITFLYDAGFPHVIEALQPQGRYFFSYRSINEYIRSDGPLAKFKQ